MKIKIGMKGIVLTTKIIALMLIIVAAVYFVGQQGLLPNINLPSTSGTGTATTTIKTTAEASKKIISMSATIDDLGSLVEDIDKSIA